MMGSLRARMSGEEDQEIPFARANIEAKVVDWTCLDELASESLRRALTSLPLEQISPVCEDDQGVHLYRVLERRPARTIPLAEASDSIRAELLRRRRLTVRRELLMKLRDEAEITRSVVERTTTKRQPKYDAGDPGDRPLSDAAPQRRPASFSPRTRAEFLQQGARARRPMSRE